MPSESQTAREYPKLARVPVFCEHLHRDIATPLIFTCGGLDVLEELLAMIFLRVKFRQRRHSLSRKLAALEINR